MWNEHRYVDGTPYLAKIPQLFQCELCLTLGATADHASAQHAPIRSAPFSADFFVASAHSTTFKISTFSRVRSELLALFPGQKSARDPTQRSTESKETAWRFATKWIARRPTSA